jgi:hypothetical protein
MQAVSDRLKKATSTRKGLWQLLAHCIALCLLVACEGPEAQYKRCLSRLGHILSEDTPVTQQPALPEPPDTDQLHLNIPPSSLDTLDFLALSGCAVQATIGKRNSSLGRMASDSQRLLLALEYLQLAPRCITYQRERGATLRADTLQRAWQLQRQQLPALIFNATLGGNGYRALWHRSAPGENHPAASSGQVVYALQAINGHARRWLAGDYRADNRTFEILLSEVTAGDGDALLLDLAGQGLRYRELLPPIAALEELLSSALPPDYRNWKSERNARITKLATAPDPPVEQLKASLGRALPIRGQR